MSTSTSSVSMSRYPDAVLSARRYGMYALAASCTAGRCDGWSRGDVRLCFFKASLNTLRLVVASKGRDGCVLLVRNSERFAELVVGRANGNGISRGCWVVLV
jgi:hypothetical protein